MFFFSFAIMGLETIMFHQLLVVTNYLKATFIISIAMFGMAVGSFAGFYLVRIKGMAILTMSSFGFLGSVILSYYNLVNIGTFTYPIFLVLPFAFLAIIVSSIFAKAHSNIMYFANLVGSAFGVAYPVFMVPYIKSENAIIVLLFIPAIFTFVVSFGYKNLVVDILHKVAGIALVILVAYGLNFNLSVPSSISKNDFQNKVLPQVTHKRDREFIKKAYVLNKSKGVYELKRDSHPQKYDEKRAKYVLQDVGYLPAIDLNSNIVCTEEMRNYEKFFCPKYGGIDDYKVVLSEDSLISRVELLAHESTKRLYMGQNGALLDEIDRANGSARDPRVPWIRNGKIFIVGLSADGIVKSAKRLPGAEVHGVEIHPTIRRIMLEDGPFKRMANYPYRNVKAYDGEGRYLLETSDTKYDMITLMNIHAEYGPTCTLAPEFFHTVEGTKILLNSVSKRGMVVYEEIVLGNRARFAYQKFMNTIVASMKELGYKNPRDHIVVFSWSFWGKGFEFKTITIKNTPFSKAELNYFNKYLSVVKTMWPEKEKPIYIEMYPGRNTRSKIERGTFPKSGKPSYNTEHFPNYVTMKEFKKDVLDNLKSEDDKKFLLSKYKIKNRKKWIISKVETDNSKKKDWFFYKKKYKKEKIKIQRMYLKRRALSKNDKAKFRTILAKADYPYEIDLSPTYDDKPFPFNVYKNKKEVRVLLELILMLTALLFIPVIILLIKKFRTHKLTLGSHVLFFAIMGLGFLLTEIVLMQKYQRFIGSPTYSLIITLGGLLFFSGLGSYFSRKWSKKALVIAAAVIPLLLLFHIFFIDGIFTFFGKNSFNVKLLISSVLLFPLTFLMGVPFPHMMEQVKADVSEEYSTLMYGVNGAFSSIAATSAVLVNVTYGFNTTFMIGFVIYFIGLILFAVMKK